MLDSSYTIFIVTTIESDILAVNLELIFQLHQSKITTLKENVCPCVLILCNRLF